MKVHCDIKLCVSGQLYAPRLQTFSKKHVDVSFRQRCCLWNTTYSLRHHASYPRARPGGKGQAHVYVPTHTTITCTHHQTMRQHFLLPIITHCARRPEQSCNCGVNLLHGHKGWSSVLRMGSCCANKPQEEAGVTLFEFIATVCSHHQPTKLRQVTKDANILSKNDGQSPKQLFGFMRKQISSSSYSGLRKAAPNCFLQAALYQSQWMRRLLCADCLKWQFVCIKTCNMTAQE
mmetsp:Transcript_8960/g.17133  ORF Transcript_8960/g.17133 Transcript_8960/m.17133 type:complete len:233 (-) Transcript_8960:81-779(-)